jgi:hypothetical protein
MTGDPAFQERSRKAPKQNSLQNLSVLKAAPVFGTLYRHRPMAGQLPADTLFFHPMR